VKGRGRIAGSRGTGLHRQLPKVYSPVIWLVVKQPPNEASGSVPG
jgi:hypothetical protein